MADDGGAKLLVRHLPLQLNASDKEDLLKHFGAKEVICMERRGKLRDAAFAVFTDSDSAAKAISQLHQLNVLGSRLTVEYAKVCHERLAAQQCSRVSPQTTLGDNDNKEEQKPASEHNGKEKLKSNKSGMAPGLGIDYAPNPSLHYVYPPPTASVLTNIAHTLACVPRFYVQVLHLMNKMNLPAPFGQVTPTPPLLDDTQMNPPVAALSDDDNISSDESEIESDEEERQKRARQKAEIVQRLSESRSETRAKKRPGKLHLSRPSAKKAKPTVRPSKHTPVEKAFEQAMAQPKKIEFKLTEAISTIFESGPPLAEPTPPETEGFGMFAPALEAVVENRDENEEVTMEESSDFISSAELNAKRMSSKEMSEMSALKNYTPGEPTCRLYLKNLAKHVEEKDLLYIFGRYVNHDLEQEKNRFDIRLMKEGRMKGQAFVTLPSEEKAKKALRDVHGYILQGKPIVIQFARSAKSKD